MSYTVVGTLNPGEAFVNYTTNKWSVHPGSTTVNVYDSPQIFKDNGISYVYVGILHNGTFPVNGYIAATDSLAAIDYCFYTIDFVGSQFPTQTYYVFQTQKALDVFDQAGNYKWTMQSGTYFATPTGAPGDTYKYLMIAYAYLEDNKWWSLIDPPGTYGFIDTGVRQGSSCTAWGIKLNRTC
ncbi:hypothetical protein GCM10025857_06560 [Alicyclobacillus contaminans]|uniref:hypothetical protein n=1 Tax=Alicyclobacillus contaminans TaxID=392016 RepID=UPI0003F9BA56|nr:hypothetical protein [Alicyclobacillus contaminans]GMA49299.1 hypothetical protein GCM10025857_06560 [Alicyclobacillus contaminans]